MENFELNTSEKLLVDHLLKVRLEECKHQILKIRKNISDTYYEPDVNSSYKHILENLINEKDLIENLLKKLEN